MCDYGRIEFTGTGGTRDFSPFIKNPKDFKEEIERRMHATVEVPFFAFSLKLPGKFPVEQHGGCRVDPARIDNAAGLSGTNRPKRPGRKQLKYA